MINLRMKKKSINPIEICYLKGGGRWRWGCHRDGENLFSIFFCKKSVIIRNAFCFLHNCPPNHETEEIHKSVTSVPEALCPLPAGHVIFFFSFFFFEGRRILGDFFWNQTYLITQTIFA